MLKNGLVSSMFSVKSLSIFSDVDTFSYSFTVGESFTVLSQGLLWIVEEKYSY
jgi:predicted type IV restriction endonuclease